MRRVRSVAVARLRLPGLVAFLTVSLCSGTLFGQDAPEERPVLFETATVTARAIEGAATRVELTTAAELQESPVSSLSAALEIEGVSFFDNGSPAFVGAPVLRGGDPNFTLVLIDGVPVNDATDSFGGAVDLDALDVHAIERVEVVRGPASSVYGSTALGGVIHVLTKTSSQSGTTLLLEGGEDARQRAVASWSGVGERARATLVATHRASEGIVGDDDYEGRSASFRGDLAQGASSVWHYALRFSSEDTLDYGDGSGGPGLGDGSLRESESRDVSGRLRFHRVGATRELGAQVSFSSQDLDRASPAIFPVIPAGVEDTRFEQVLASLQATWQRSASRFSLGFEGESEDGENRSALLFPFFALPGDYQLERDQLAAFAEWVSNGPLWTIELGARLDQPDRPDAAASGDDEELSPRVAVARTFGGGRHRLRASAGRAFKLPSLYALGSPPALGGNPDLLPETSEGWDVGVDLRSREGGVSFSATVFSMTYDDLIDFDFTTFRLVNLDEVRARGVELATRWRPSSRLSLAATATLQDVEDQSTGETLRRRPDWQGSVRATLHATQRLRLSGAVRLSDDFVDAQIPAPDRTTVDGREVIALAAEWTLAKRWSVGARLENALDETYETQIGFPAPRRAASIAVRYGR